jgi:hypothetical protein
MACTAFCQAQWLNKHGVLVGMRADTGGGGIAFTALSDWNFDAQGGITDWLILRLCMVGFSDMKRYAEMCRGMQGFEDLLVYIRRCRGSYN